MAPGSFGCPHPTACFTWHLRRTRVKQGRGHTRHRPTLEVVAVPRAQIKDEKTYQALRREGAGKEKAARIANDASRSSRSSTGRKGGKAGSYEDRTKDELYEQAKKVGIEGRSQMSKDELIKALRKR
ncbi:Rho termination factor N-terminal domain-containing protein [Streptomyces xanthii]|uniref:Rho termination factor N-terminal domain-containing protein n=1 Tax=Streptomyces xanthii TaxID=2768069 RepID=A0A7H1BGQ4_9ACTN|nr:Rho termination factor N-terminal domain-containing protein [Streptomyces xanthii]